MIFPAVGKRVVAMAAAIAEVSEAALRGRSRVPELCELRFAIALVLKERGWSHSRISIELGRRDHSTVNHQIRRAGALLVADPEFAALVDALRAAARAPLLPPLPKGLAERFVRLDAPLVTAVADDEDIGAEEEIGEHRAAAKFAAMMASGSQRLALALRGFAEMRAGGVTEAVTG